MSVKRFRQYIEEANYGALQSDKRIAELRDKLIKKLVDKWMREYRTDVTVTALTRRDDPYLDDWETKLQIVRDTPSDEVPKDLIFYSGLTAQRPWRDAENHIIIVIRDDVDYEEAIRRVDEIKPLLSHEIKHAMNNNDKRFASASRDAYITSDVNYKKYVTQIQEIENFLITVIEDLELVRKKNPNISFSDALNESWWWNHLLKTALYDYRKLTKFKSKLAIYWNRKEMNNVKVDVKSLRLQLMLLLYQWHKDGDVKSAKEKGMSVKKLLMQNIEHLNLQQLKDKVEHFKKLIAERG